MFHLLVCLRQTWTLFSSGCPASFRGLPVQISLPPARLLRVCPRDPGPAVPLGKASLDREVGLPLTSLYRPLRRASLVSHREPPLPRRYPRGRAGAIISPGLLQAGGRAHASAPPADAVGTYSSIPPAMSPSLGARGVRPCWPPWARREWLRVPDHLVPPHKSTETLLSPQLPASLNEFSRFQGGKEKKV